MPRYEVFINAGLTLDDVKAKDRDAAIEKVAAQFQKNIKEHGEDLARNSEIEVYKIEEE